MAIRDATPIVLTAAERRLVERAEIVLLAAAGQPSRAIAREVGCARGVVSKWRTRFARDRLAGLALEEALWAASVGDLRLKFCKICRVVPGFEFSDTTSFLTRMKDLSPGP